MKQSLEPSEISTLTGQKSTLKVDRKNSLARKEERKKKEKKKRDRKGERRKRRNKETFPFNPLFLGYRGNFADGHRGGNIVHLLQFQGAERWPLGKICKLRAAGVVKRS